MRDLFKPSTWFDQPRRLVAMLIGAAVPAFLIVSSLGPNWADAGAPASAPPPATVTAPLPMPAPAPPAAQAPAVPTEAALRMQEPQAATQDRYDARLQAVEARQFDVLTRIIESRSKTLDWWLAFLGTFTAVIGVLGALVPFLLTRTLREQAAHDREQVLAMRSDVERIKKEADGLLNSARSNAQQIDEHRRDLEAKAESLLQQPPPTLDDANGNRLAADIAEAARSIKNDPTAHMVDQLRAEALLAGDKNDADKALSLWDALAQLAPNDLQSVFMSAYWNQELATRAARADTVAEARRLWCLAGEHYKQALTIKPDMSEAANNWGIALSAEATAVAASDLSEARRLWALAGERYQRALATKPDMHEAAFNWGSALHDEATAVVLTDLSEARRLWALAGERFQQAMAIKPDKHEAAYNWGNALRAEAKAVETTDLPAARRLWALAGERFQQAMAIKPDKHEAANNWGNALGAEATAVSATDLTEARQLWARAGERYQQALAIKPDKQEAAYNWGNALRDEATAVVGTDLSEARRLWKLAGERYKQSLTIKSDNHEAAYNWGIVLQLEATAIVGIDLPEARRLWTLASELFQQALPIRHKGSWAAYNLARTKARLRLVSECVYWLETARLNDYLPSREHLESDAALDGIRHSPEFVAWWATHFKPADSGATDN